MTIDLVLGYFRRLLLSLLRAKMILMSENVHISGEVCWNRASQVSQW